MALDRSRLGLENKFLENKSGRFFCVRQVYVIKSSQPIRWRGTSLLYFLYIASELKQHIYYEALFLPYRPQTECAQLLYFTILQDKLHSFNIQDDRSTSFLCITNYRIDGIIKRFHEENPIMMSGLFRQNNLLLCGMQGNNGLLAKTLKIFPNHLQASRFSLLTSAKFAVRAGMFE